jgi:hypothetical protein
MQLDWSKAGSRLAPEPELDGGNETYWLGFALARNSSSTFPSLSLVQITMDERVRPTSRRRHRSLSQTPHARDCDERRV